MRNTVFAKNVFIKAFDFFFFKKVNDALNSSFYQSSFMAIFKYSISD